MIPRTSRARYQDFVRDYRLRRLDEAAEPDRSAAGSGPRRPPAARRREYLRDYLRPARLARVRRWNRA